MQSMQEEQALRLSMHFQRKTFEHVGEGTWSAHLAIAELSSISSRSMNLLQVGFLTTSCSPKPNANVTLLSG